MTMKVVHYVLIAVFVSSCSRDEIINDYSNEDRIEFNAGVENYTRTASTFGPIDITALRNSSDGFAVSTSGLGVNMNNLVVKYDGSKWAYTGDYFWSINPSQSATFTAYAPAGTANVTLAATGLTATNFIPGTTPASQIDLIYASPASFSRGTSGKTGVNFTFRHLLTQIVFSVTSDISASNNPQITSIVLTVPRSKGSYNPSTGAWTAVANSVNYTVFNNNTISATPVVSAPLLMIPQSSIPNATSARITINVNGRSRSKNVSLRNLTTVTSWQSGYKVTYNVSIPKADVPGATRAGAENDFDIIITAEEKVR